MLIKAFFAADRFLGKRETVGSEDVLEKHRNVPPHHEPLSKAAPAEARRWRILRSLRPALFPFGPCVARIMKTFGSDENRQQRIDRLSHK